ncbi:hypothetical protein KI387_016824 [Taxus chinensis]|uniref:Uncharacterized protein n=1 Tax=Taxus chinensis TaxID=29808 RepID=A0AA38GJG9_TAXCH|nr:hypothetical protein KI387_016824 [Taxus chinensis]
MVKLMDGTLFEGLLIKVICIDARNPHTNGHYRHINHLKSWRKHNNILSDCYPDMFKLVSPSFTLLFCNYPSFQSMGGQLKHLEPDNCEPIKNDEEVWNILLENGIAIFLEKMTGYSALVSYAVTASWSKGRVQVGNTRFTISTNAIVDATSLPATGDIYYKRSLHTEIQDFNAPGDRPKKYLSGYTRDSLPSPWDRVVEVIMRYFTIDGRYWLVFGPHLFILSHLRWGKIINLAAFLFQSLEHSVQLAQEGEGIILHQGLLYLLFSVGASHSDFLRFPPKLGCRRRSPSPSPRPSSSSLRSSRRRRHLLLSSTSNSDVAIVSPPRVASIPPDIPSFPTPTPISCFFLEGTEASGRTSSPVSSLDYSQATNLLGLAKLYPDSPGTEQCDVSQPVADPISQVVGSKALLDEFFFAADTLHSTHLMDTNPADSESADAKGVQCSTDLVSSILSKLQHAFKALKDWEAFTESTRNAIANDCMELIKLADLMANDSGSPRAKKAVSKLKKLF